MRWRWPRQSISNPSCTRPSRCMRAPTPTSSRKSTQTCSRTPARMRPSTCSPVWRSRITASMPALARSCPSSRPDGPAPTMATCVRLRGHRSMLRAVAFDVDRVHAVAPLRVRGRGRGHEREQRPRRHGLARVRADGRRERGDDLDRRRQRPEHGRCLRVRELRLLLKAELDLAARHQPAHGNAGRRGDDPVPDLLGDAPALEQPVERDAARAGGDADRARRQHRVLERVLAADLRSRAAGADGDRDARAHQIDLAAGDEVTAGEQLCRSRRAPAPRRRRARPPARAWRRRRRRRTGSRPCGPSGSRRRAPARRARSWVAIDEIPVIDARRPPPTPPAAGPASAASASRARLEDAWTTRPRSRTMAWAVSSSARRACCSTSTSASPPSSTIRRMAPDSSWTMMGASPSIGSSSSSTRGFSVSARPMASICCSPPGQLVAVVAAALLQARKQLEDARRVPVAVPRDRREVLVDGQRRKHPALLRHPAEAGARPAMRRQHADVVAVEEQAAGVQAGESHDREQEGGLARPVAAQDRQAAARDDPERHAFQHDGVAVPRRDAVEAEEIRHGARLRDRARARARRRRSRRANLP